jgi:uncharacterized protein YjbK
MTDKSPAPAFQEIEIKLKLDENTYQGLSTLFPAERQPVLQENIFFDSTTYTLLKQHWGLRLRKEKAHYYLTAKGEPEKKTGVYIRPEYEVQLTPEAAAACQAGFTLAALPVQPAQELLKLFGNLTVRPIFSFTNERQFFKFAGWTLELDKTLIKGEVFFELEGETSLAELAPCQKQLQELFAAHGWFYEPSRESKMEKAIRLFLPGYGKKRPNNYSGI